MPLITPIKYKGADGRSLDGFKAELLPKVCNIYLDARRQGVLTAKQDHLVQQAEILLSALATTGIIAIVDEATGYQEIREKDALRKILEKFISPILLPYATRFPREFYLETYRLRGWDYTPIQQGKAAKTPLLGKITNDVVYNRLVPGALNELNKVNPERDEKGRLKHHHHRHLTEDQGVPTLDKHLASIVTIMKLSDSWEDFYVKLNKIHPHHRNVEIEDGNQLKLNLKEASKHVEDSFDKAIMRASIPSPVEAQK